MSTPVGIYIHVPFCAKKCPYCDFYSVNYTRAAALTYAEAVCRAIAAHPAGICADTVYFGGGTPSLLPADCLRRILEALRARFCLQEPEITLEVNPLTATDAALEAWRTLGINRLSFGMQSCVDEELRLLGRRHTAEQACTRVRRAAALGFGNLSCDLMLGTAAQTCESLAVSLACMTALPIQHISAYMLSVEAGTPYDCTEMREQVASGDQAAALYVQMAEALEQAGFAQYEISNFARPGYESRHNLKYWQCVDYLGIGPAAHGCFGGVRYAAPADLDAFTANPLVREVTEPNPYDVTERVMLGLRLTEGICLSDFSGAEAALLRQRAAKLAGTGLLRLAGDRLSLTKQGFLVSNAVIGALLE